MGKVSMEENIEFNDLGIDLPSLQKVELEMLIEYDRICKKYDIIYQLFAGTLLGAVRHQGFIPWDDDIDVCMLREDYNRFLQACEKELNDQYFLQTYETERNNFHSFARIRKNNTLAVQDAFSDFDIHHGIFIDIFPIDKVAPNTSLGKIQRSILYPFKYLKYLKNKKEILRTEKRYKRWGKLFIHYLVKPISLRNFNRLETKIATLFADKETKYATLLANGNINDYWRYLIKVDEFRELSELEFEGNSFLVPKNYHETLERNFGSYMELPPLSERIPHHRLIELKITQENE